MWKYKYCIADHEEVVQLLIKNGANINAIEQKIGSTPLISAAMKGTIRIHIWRNANEKKTYQSNQLLSFHFLITWSGLTNYAKILIKNGANISHTDVDGNTALHWAAQSGALFYYSVIFQKLVTKSPILSWNYWNSLQ